MTNKDAKDHLIWIDLEMTGLQPSHDVIIEIATLVTDKELNVIAEGPQLAINQPDSILENMDSWNTKHHTQSGLVDRVRKSDVTVDAAQAQTLAFLREHVKAGTSPMCGNSICQDRRFMAKWMPALESYFHYRHLDVSTIKILAANWRPKLLSDLKKESRHIAMEDIKDSIEELRFYREHFFNLGDN